VKGDVRVEIVQPFYFTSLFQILIMLDMYLQHMQPFTKIMEFLGIFCTIVLYFNIRGLHP